MASYQQQLQDIFARYQAEVSQAPVDLKEVGKWAMGKGMWAPRPVDVLRRFSSDLADALREEYRTDEKTGRRYRTKLAVTTWDGERQGSLWGDSDTAPRSHVVKSVAQRRRQVVADCYQLRVDVDQYNADRPDEEPIQLVLDFTDDVAEQLVANGIKDDEAA